MNTFKQAAPFGLGVMIDIETFGQGKNAVIASIAACAFNFESPEGLEEWGSAEVAAVLEQGSYFYKHVDIETQPQRDFDGATIKWWMKQEEAARSSVFGINTLPLGAALEALAHWYPQGYNAFSYASTFDLVILGEAYKQLELIAPWTYREELCARTVINLTNVQRPRDFPMLTPHNALDDVLFQIVWFQRAWKRLRGGINA